MSKLISIIAPVYNEEKNIENFYNEVLKSVKLIKNIDYEFVFINDWSKDCSLVKLEKLAVNDKNVKILNFSRNFWHEIALKAWVDNVSWDYVIIMDSDLQDPPELIVNMFNKILEWNDLVYAKRKSRKDWVFKDFTAFCFYRILNLLSNTNIPKDTGNFRIFNKKVLNEFKKLREQSRFTRGLFAWLWFKVSFVEFDRKDRLHWKTNYSFFDMIKLSFDWIFSFSIAPLRVASILWFIMSIFWFFWIISIIYVKFFTNITYAAWTATIMVLVLLIWWIQLSIMWIVWEYIWRIYKDVQWRPLYIIDKKLNFDI